MATTMTAAATGSRHSLRYIPEATFGTTPATPAMVALRHTSCSLVLSKDSFTSNELRDDRQISDHRLGANKVAGDIGFELSYGEYDPLLESALQGAWTSDVLEAGVDLTTFSIERKFGGINQYGVFTGCAVNTLALSIKPNAIVTGTFGLVGKAATYSGTSLDDTPTASQANSPFDSFTGAIKEGGSTIAVVTGLDLNLNNGVTPEYVIGSPSAGFLTSGRSNVTGTVTAFFSSLALLNKFVNETETSIEMTLGNGTAKSLKILLPRVKFTGAENAVSGEGAVSLSLPFQALLDSTTGTNIQLTRIP